MLKYITEKEYKDLLGVQSVPSNFERLIIEASEYINGKTFGRIDENNIPEKVKFVTCLIVNNLNDKENQKSQVNLKSESLEGWSRTYVTPLEVERDFEVKNREILNQYLWNVIGKDGNPLLYTGVC